jgi:hypothetical protein
MIKNSGAGENMRQLEDLISKYFLEIPDKSKCQTLHFESGEWGCLTAGSCPYATYSGSTKYCKNPAAKSFEKIL